jgi:hypothetical protein
VKRRAFICCWAVLRRRGHSRAGATAGAITPEEQLLDVEAWRLAQEHLEQAKYASWQREAEQREAQKAKERAKAGTV